MDEKKKYDGKVLKCGKRTYFFDVHEAKNGHKYLVVTESQFVEEGERKRNSFILFKEDLGQFCQMLGSINLD